MSMRGQIGETPRLHRRERLVEWSLFAVVVLIAVCLRTYHLGSRGLINHDEGYYVNAAKSPYYALKWLLGDQDLREQFGLKEYLENHGCSNPREKPGHILLLSFGFLAFGMREVSPLLVSVVFGTLSVVWIYVFGRRRLGYTWTIFSMAILAVSFLHLHYSRSALYVSSVFFSFLVLHIYIWSLEKKPLDTLKWMFLIGLLLGFCLSIDQKIIFFIGCLAVTDAYIVYTRKRLHVSLLAKRLAACACGLLALTLCIELVYQVLYRSQHLISEYPTYLAFFFQSKVNAMTESYTWDFSDLLFYPRAILQIEGIVFFLGVSAGLFLFLRALRREHRPLYLFSVLLWITTLVFWTVRSGGHTSLKVIPILLPTGAIMAGFAFKQLHDFVHEKTKNFINHQYVVVSILLVILIYGSVHARPLLAVENVYAEAISRVGDRLRQSGGKVLAFDQGAFSPVAMFYFGLEVDRDPALMSHVLFDQGAKEENQYYFATWHNYGKDENLRELLTRSKNAEVVLEIPDTSVRSLPPLLFYLRGGSVLSRYVLQPLKRYEHFDSVLVYQLAQPSL